MLSNKWMLICTLLASIITVALLSSIPTYTFGIMQRMLIKDLENSQKASGSFPGGYLVNYEDTNGGSNNNGNMVNLDINGIVTQNVDLPVLAKYTYVDLGDLSMDKNDSGENTTVDLCSLTDMKSHIKMLSGRMFSSKKEADTYEVILTDAAMKVLNLTLGNTYTLTNESFFNL